MIKYIGAAYFGFGLGTVFGAIVGSVVTFIYIYKVLFA